MSLIDQITGFLAAIGIECRVGEVPDKTFLPGVVIDQSALVFDPAKLTYPGDLLHEAGHLAVMSPSRRAKAQWDVSKRQVDEIMAILWSYAAVVKLGIDPAVVFHSGGYKGASEGFIDNFTNGRYPGLPALQWLGLAADEKNAAALGIEPFPAMIKWLNDEELDLGRPLATNPAFPQ